MLLLNDLQGSYVSRTSSVEYEEAAAKRKVSKLVKSILPGIAVAIYMPIRQERLSGSPYYSRRYWVLAEVSENV